LENKKTGDSLTKAKQRRGRPRLPTALTPAQRAKRYRDKKRVEKRAGKSVDILPIVQDMDVCAENVSLQQDLQEAQKYIHDLTGALEVVVTTASKGKRIPAEVIKGLYRLLASR
jgi:hypothetical protein